MSSRTISHGSDWVLFTFVSLCCCILFIPASAASEPVWVCPHENLGEELYIVPPSRIFSDTYKDRKYCCPINGFIDQDGNCGSYICPSSISQLPELPITICPDVPQEWRSVAEFESSFRYYRPNSYESSIGSVYNEDYSKEEMALYTRHRICCPGTALCISFTNVSTTINDQENYSVFDKMFVCMTMYDTDGNMIDQDNRPTGGWLSLKPLPQSRSKYEPVAAIDISSHCDSKPCGAKGVCTPTFESYTCLCPPPFKFYPGGPEFAFDKNCKYMLDQASQTYQSVSTAVCGRSWLCEPLFSDQNRWQTTGVQAFPCPAGQYCANTPSSSENGTVCTGAGYICPPASSEPLLCPEGFYCSDSKTKLPCPAGMYCAPGTKDPSTCPRGSFCSEAEPFYDTQKQLVQRASPKIRCARMQQSVTCPAGSSAPAALPAGSCGSSSRKCVPGWYCPQLCSYSKSCEVGNYCPDGKNLVTCPRGHECPTLATSPLKCRAGTYEPYEGMPGWRGNDGSTITCEWPCRKWHWNSDGATNCDSLSVWSYLFIFGMIILIPMVLFGIYSLFRYWWPAFRTLYATASEDFNSDWNARTQVYQQELVQRIVREVMLMPISVQSSRMITASNSPSPPSANSQNSKQKSVEITPELNLSLLSEYRTFLSKVFLEFLQSPDCPSIIWLLCQYKHLSVIDLQMHMSNGIKSEVMENFHSFATAYTHAQENLSSRQCSASSQQNGEEAPGFTPLPADVLWDATAEMRATLKSEFFLYADSWIQLKRSTNTSIQDLSWIFGGVHFPTGESRLKPPRLPAKLTLQCAALSLAQVCRGRLSVAVELIRQRVARFTGHAGALTDSQNPSSSSLGRGGDVEMSSNPSAATGDTVNIVIPPSSSSNPPTAASAMSKEHLPSTDQFKHALDSDGSEVEEPKSNIGTHLVDASIEASDEL